MEKSLKDLKSGKVFDDHADVVFAADGAFSSIRYNSMQKVDHSICQFYVEDGYKVYYFQQIKMVIIKLKKCFAYMAKRKIYVNFTRDGSCTLFMP